MAVQGTMYVKLTFLPFLQPTFDDEDDDAATQAKRAAKKAAPPRPATRVVTHNIHDKLKVTCVIIYKAQEVL
jgi:hypothetical protein